MNKAPSIPRVLRLIREMGLTAGYSSDFQEFRVAYRGNPDSSYFTESRLDALFTARDMATKLKKD